MYDLVIQSPDGSGLFYPPFEKITIREELNKGYDGSISVSYPDIKKYAQAFNLTPDDIFASGAKEWYVRKNEVNIFGGILLDRRINGGGSGMTTYAVNIADFSMLLDKRITSGFWQRLSTDSGVIVSDLLDFTNALSDTLITMGTQPSLKVRDLTSRFEKIRDKIVSMSALKKHDGYDWDCDVTKKLNLYTSKGVERLYLVFDEFNTISFQNNRQLQGRLTNKVIVLGKGSEDEMATSTREDAPSQATLGLLEDTLNEKGVGTVSELADRGDVFLTNNATPQDVVNLKHRDGSPDIISYGVGDTVKVKFSEINFDQSMRIYKRTIQIDSSEDANVDVSFV